MLQSVSITGGEFQDPLLSAPVIPTIVPALPPISQVYVPRRPWRASRARVPAHVGSSLPLPPSTSTSADPSLPLSDSDLDLPIAVRKGETTSFLTTNKKMSSGSCALSVHCTLSLLISSPNLARGMMKILINGYSSEGKPDYIINKRWLMVIWGADDSLAVSHALQTSYLNT
ncbi:hypothetical protein HHK36_019670 [Tetracentron sinense]|uniref:Uncharacterized protein n=1 Tax=Tetracentron sinense TaxID=13715 RepID=A0A834YWM5_TETSI|nr:hypothetical protein HHK36_019670 [Tetracentron sinense]